MEEQVNKSSFKAEQLEQECIFLRNKIIILETK